MLVSIIIPIYNVAPYVEQCLQSVVAQTYEGEIECLLIDDCGTDDSMDICERFISEYQGPVSFRIFCHEHNRGLSAARNTGIKASQGEYLYFLDSDDCIFPDCISSFMDRIVKYPCSQLVFSGAVSNIDGWEFLDYTCKELPDFSDDRDWLQLILLKRLLLGMTAWNKLISREFLFHNNLFFIEGIVQEDEIWNFDISKHIEFASFIRHNTYFYNVRTDSIMKMATEDIRHKRLFAIWNLLISRIGGRNKHLQIKGIYKYIYEEKPCFLMLKERLLISFLYIKLAFKSLDSFSFRLLFQSFKVLW